MSRRGSMKEDPRVVATRRYEPVSLLNIVNREEESSREGEKERGFCLYGQWLRRGQGPQGLGTAILRRWVLPPLSRTARFLIIDSLSLSFRTISLVDLSFSLCSFGTEVRRSILTFWPLQSVPWNWVNLCIYKIMKDRRKFPEEKLVDIEWKWKNFYIFEAIYKYEKYSKRNFYLYF